MASKRRQRRIEQRGHKQHLFDGEEEVSEEMLAAHRELEFLRAGARIKRPHSEQAKHMIQRTDKLMESRS